jgi:hypothetical protein
VEVKLRLLGILLSWPAVTLYLGLLFIFLFRIQLSELIGRIVEGEFPGGLKFRAAAAQQSAKPDPEAIEQKAIDAVAVVGEAGDTLASTTQVIAPKGFDSSAFGHTVVKEPNETDQLRGALAVVSKWLIFEQTLNMIFGSQLSFLHAVQMRPDGITFLETFSYYGIHKNAMKATASSWEVWFGWMVTRELIMQPSADAVSWRLHPKGAEFLGYIHQAYPNVLPFRVG